MSVSYVRPSVHTRYTSDFVVGNCVSKISATSTTPVSVPMPVPSSIGMISVTVIIGANITGLSLSHFVQKLRNGVSTNPIFSAVGSIFSLNIVFCGVFMSLMISAVGCFPLQMVAISIQIGRQHTNL